MRHFSHKQMRYGVVAGLAALALLVPSIRPAYAYFTDQSHATGGLIIRKPSTDIQETYGEKVKHVVITNDAESTPVFVRARVYANAEYLEAGGVGGTDWTQVGDWYYYQGNQGVLEPGGKTSELLVTIKFPTSTTTIEYDADGNPIKTDTEEADRTGENFNVVVVYESVPVQSDADGNLLAPEAADWSLKGGE